MPYVAPQDDPVDEIYYPPEGIYFRLNNPSWQYCIFARDSHPPYTGTVWADLNRTDPQASHYFTLVKDPKVANRWHLKNKATGKFVMAYIDDDNSWATTSDKMCDETMMRFEKSTKAYLDPNVYGSKPFEIIFGKTASKQGWLRCNDEGFWTPKWSGDHDESGNQQFWILEYENLVFDHIEWETPKGQIIYSQPKVLDEYILNNPSDSPLTVTGEWKHKLSQTNEFTHAHGISIKGTVEGKAGIPLVAEGKVKVETAYDVKFTVGKKTTEDIEKSAKFELKAQPWKKVHARARVNVQEATVPYVAFYRSKVNNVYARSWGEWRGTQAWVVDITQEDVKDADKNLDKGLLKQ